MKISRVITVTLNPSIDRVLCETAVDNAGIRTKLTNEVAGGKGNNVARILTRLKVPVVAVTCAGGWNGSRLIDLLADEGLSLHIINTPNPVRFHTTLLRTGSEPCYVHEAGAGYWAPVLAELISMLREIHRDGDLVLLAGSPPSDSPETFYRDLLDQLPAGPVGIDVGPTYLRQCMVHRPYFVKVNQFELLEASVKATGIGDGPDVLDAIRWAASFTQIGAVATLGAQGAIGILDGQSLKVETLGEPARGIVSALGAGDAFMAGFVWGLVEGDTMRGCLSRAEAVAVESLTWQSAGVIDSSHVNLRAVRVSSVIG